MQEAFVTRCLAQSKLNTLVIACERSKIGVMHLQHALAEASSARALCKQLFGVGQTATQRTTPLHALFAHAAEPVLLWLITALPLDLLTQYRCPEVNNTTVLHVLAARQRIGDAFDQVLDEFAPRFFGDQARSEALEVLDDSGQTPVQYLSAANNFAAYRSVAEGRALAGSTTSAETLMLDRARHDLERAVNQGEALRARAEAAERTSAAMEARYHELEAKIAQRTAGADELRAQVATLAKEKAQLEQRQADIVTRQTEARATAKEADTRRREQEALLVKDRDVRAKLRDRATKSEQVAEQLAHRVLELEAVARAADDRVRAEAAENASNIAARQQLEQALAESALRVDQTAEQKATERAAIDAQLAALTKSTEELSKRYITAEAARKKARESARALGAERETAVADAAHLRNELQTAAARTQALEERLEQLSAAQSADEQRCAALRVELAAVQAEQATSTAAYEAQATELRAANETLSIDLEEARRVQATTCELAAREQAAAETALGEAHTRVADELKRATEAAEQLASAAARNAELERVAAQYCESARQIELDWAAQSSALAQRLADMQQRVDASERAVGDAQAAAAARLEVAEQKLNEARRSVHDERAEKRELSDRIATLSTSPTIPARMVSPRAALKRPPSTSSKKARPGDAVESDEPSTPRGLTPRGKTLLRRSTSVASVRPGGPAPAPPRLAHDAAIAALAQSVSEGDEPLALAMYKLNEQLWLGLRDAMARADVKHVGDLFRLGLSANTRDPATRATLLETAVRAACDIESTQGKLGDEVRHVGTRLVALIDLVLRNGGEWDGVDAFLRHESRRIPAAVAAKLQQRDDIAPFCCAVLGDAPAKVERLIGNVLDIDRVPAQDADKQLTYLHHAVLNGSAHIVYLLVLHHADVGVIDSRGRTPLHLALTVKFKRPSDRAAIVEYLLAGGADPSAQSGVAPASSSEDEAPAPVRRRRGVFSRLRAPKVPTPGGPPNLATGDNTTPLAMAGALGDAGVLMLLQQPRYRRVTVAKMRDYVERSVALHTTVARMTAMTPPLLNDHDYEYKLFTLYGNAFHAFNPHFVALYGEDYSTARLRVSAELRDDEAASPRGTEKLVALRRAHHDYVDAALKALATESRAGNASLRWELLKQLEYCITAVCGGWFDVSELVRRPAREVYDEAALELLAEKIAADDRTFVDYVVGRRDRLFGSLFEVDAVVDQDRDLRGDELAACSGSVGVLQWYLERQPMARASMANARGQTLVSFACDSAQPLAVVALDWYAARQYDADDLVSERHPNACHYGITTHKTRNTALHLAVFKGRNDLMAFCIDRVPRQARAVNARNQTPFDVAVGLLATQMSEARRGIIQDCADQLAAAALVSTGAMPEARSLSRASLDDDTDDGPLGSSDDEALALAWKPPPLLLPPSLVDDMTDALSDPE